MLNAIAPYWQAAKLYVLGGVILLAFGLGNWTGCSVGKNQSKDTISELMEDKGKLVTQLSVTAAAVEEANRQVQANKQFAKEREKLAEDAAKDAAKAKRELDAKGKEFQKRLKDAERDPDCKAILEMNLCPLVRDY